MAAAVDGPGHVAILGAGPIGLDAALAFLDDGWSVTVYEAAASVAANVLAWSHIRLFTPWSMNISAWMRTHLGAAGIADPGPADYCPTGAEFAEQLLQPLAELPELAAVIHRGTRILAVARKGLLKHEELATPQRGSHRFRLLVSDSDGAERVEHADLLLDCTGSYHQANVLGDGGIPAPGERQAAGWTTRQIPSLTQASHGVDTLRVPEPNFFAPTLRHFSRPLRPRVVNSTPPTCSGSGDVGAAEFTTLVSSPGAEVSSA